MSLVLPAVSAYGGSKKTAVTPCLNVTDGPQTRDQSPEQTRTRASRSASARNHGANRDSPALSPRWTSCLFTPRPLSPRGTSFPSTTCHGPSPEQRPEPIQHEMPHTHQPAILASCHSGAPSSEGRSLSRSPSSHACLAWRSFSFTGLSAHAAVSPGEYRTERQKLATNPSRSLMVSLPLNGDGLRRRTAPLPKNGST